MEDLLRSIVVWRRGLRAYYDVWSTSLENGDDRTSEELLPFFTRSKKWTAPSASTQRYLKSIPPRSKLSRGFMHVYGLGGHVQINYNSFLTDLDVPVAHAVVAAAGIIQMRIQMMAQICPCPHKWLHVRWILTPD